MMDQATDFAPAIGQGTAVDVEQPDCILHNSVELSCNIGIPVILGRSIII